MPPTPTWRKCWCRPKNSPTLPGRLEIDALPQAGRIYYRSAAAASSPNAKREEVTVGDPDQVPNMFPLCRASQEPEPPTDSDTDADESAERAGNESGDGQRGRRQRGTDDDRKPARSGGFLGLFRSRNEN